MIDTQFVDMDGNFIHSTALPDTPLEGHFIRIHEDLYMVYRITWQVTRPFPYQKPGLEVTLSPRTAEYEVPLL